MRVFVLKHCHLTGKELSLKITKENGIQTDQDPPLLELSPKHINDNRRDILPSYLVGAKRVLVHMPFFLILTDDQPFLSERRIVRFSNKAIGG